MEVMKHSPTGFAPQELDGINLLFAKNE
jgi:hypothetical protein